jgi:hypothetical protein
LRASHGQCQRESTCCCGHPAFPCHDGSPVRSCVSIPAFIPSSLGIGIHTDRHSVAGWDENACDPHLAASLRPHTGVHTMILALPERDVWRNDSRTVAGRHNQLGYVGACNCGGIAGAFHWCAIHLMAARQGIPIMPSRSSWAESYAGRTDDNCREQLAGCFSHVEAMTSHAASLRVRAQLWTSQSLQSARS